jgi:DNA-binding NtrC family response regulator
MNELSGTAMAGGESFQEWAAIFGPGPGSRQVFEDIERAARADRQPVLICGEVGSGKELAARRIHILGSAATAPLLELPCRALPTILMESELFGFEKGALPWVKSRKKGLFELAAGGTLILNEIEEMPMGLQATLLSVLEQGTFRRIGGTAPIPVDVRILTITTQNLLLQIERGRFRQDLYDKLSAILISLPPLRDRREDVPALIRTLLDRFSRDLGRPVARIHPRAMDLLIAYDWPGNIRELQVSMERFVVLASGDQIRVADLPQPIRLGPNPMG